MDFVFDPQRYAGEWHEIFKIPFFWEQGCTETRAQYQVIKKDLIQLTNTCVFADKKEFSRSGQAQLIENKFNQQDQTVAKFLIEFNDGLPSDGVGDYWIHWTDYFFSVVGGPDRDFLWLLARKPVIIEKELEEFLRFVEELGYDLEKLELQKNVKVI